MTATLDEPAAPRPALTGAVPAWLGHLRAAAGLAWPYVALGSVAALVVAATTPRWVLNYNPWRVSLPGLPTDGSRPITPVLFIVAMVALGVGWAGLLVRLKRSGAPERTKILAVVVAAVAWFVPVMLGPALLSSDVYSYAAQGEMLTRGIDPTSEPMTRLQTGNFLAHIDPTWKNAKGNPYGPVQMGLAAAVVTAADHDPAASIWGLRLLALAATGVSALAVASLARSAGLEASRSLAFGIVNPIVVIHGVGGGHNETVQMAFLLGGLALALRGRRWLGVVLIACASLVKLPAAAALAFLAWTWHGPSAAMARRVRTCFEVAAVALAVTVVASLVTGVGLGWIGAMRNAGQTKGTLSPATQVGYVLSHTLEALGVGTDEELFVSALRFLALAAAGGLCLWLLKVSDRVGVVMATALAMLAVVVLGPVIWPWYFIPVFALFAVVDVGRWRPSLAVLCAAFAAEVMPSGGNDASPVLEQEHLFSLVLIVAITAATISAPRAVAWWERRRQAAVAVPPAMPPAPSPTVLD